jgi:hypothetical protein
MEYLGAARGLNREDAKLVKELGRRLDALRRFDQFFGDADWRPRIRVSDFTPQQKEAGD